jgi:hypothetical protein
MQRGERFLLVWIEAWSIGGDRGEQYAAATRRVGGAHQRR